MNITLTKHMVRNGIMLNPGTSLDLPDRQAEFFVQGGWATRTDAPSVQLEPEHEKAPAKTKAK